MNVQISSKFFFSLTSAVGSIAVLVQVQKAEVPFVCNL